MIFSCKGCTERTPGCHDHCEKYQAEKAIHEAEKEKIRKAKDIRDGLYDQRTKAVGKFVRSHGGKF